MKEELFEVFRKKIIPSAFLNRNVIYDLVLPKNMVNDTPYPTIYMNDGQDFDQLETLNSIRHYYKKGGQAFIFVAIHTNERRLSEYGTSFQADYKNRGDKATDYMNFVVSELLPLIRKETASSSIANDNTFCGFSLGGLSAMDIVWENPHLFSKVGVFSGSFWWRDKSYEEGYTDDQDRIMHNKIRKSNYKSGLKFWLECGTADETADRNNNGIIDSIEDTLDIITELKNKGYNQSDIKYVEIDGGEHNFNTWKHAFPQFLEWVFDSK
ncbi:alpha/beta hydrolase [Lacihabitans soyangensis]|uniref:Esterase family protein n=1 Tax=Lacihabitans soyangensis TaxID=869394 RepID=A0AAE3KXK3_9BACT|nr:alpha/beta hydrolase-fold protein [Lacihabitans soyangensis]MCP9765265.1 esterase family protein [Lacihabitans soyangensis]